jgi:preprotein translocase subunit SecA
MKVEEIIDGVVARFIGTKHERDIKKIQPRVDAINAFASDYEQLSDAELLAKTAELRAVVQAELAKDTNDDPEYRRSWEYKNLVNAALDMVLEPAFAAVREAGRRTLGDAAFRRAIDRRNRAASGAHRGDENG